MTREELAKEMAFVLERNGGLPWEIIDKHNKELMYKYADVAMKHIDRLEREAKAGRELREAVYHDDEYCLQCVSSLATDAYDTATKETASE